MKTPIIIGLGHTSRSGKDTFAQALISTLNEMDPKLKAARRSFATKLKDVTCQLYGWAGLQDEAYYNDPVHEHERDVVLPALGMTPVELWVKFGTPAVRQQVYDGSWVDYLLNTDHKLDVVVIPDVRFPNEVEAIRERGGHLIKVVRPGYGPRLTVADLALINYTGWDSVTMAKEMGTWLEEHEDQVLAEIRTEESPPEETRVLCASLDGVNVLLAEKGKKRGRPQERPRGPAESRESSTSYKNAMVATVSLYGEVPEGDHCPQRLQTRYAARMPEDGAPTLKAKFERELVDTERGLGNAAVRIALCDGARPLWKYIDENPLYDDYEKLVDYHHTTEHLSKAAEAIFGKGTRQSQNWYDKYCEALKGEDDGPERVLRSIDYCAQAKDLSKSRQEALQCERTFFRNNHHRMEYARFRREGWPIGSGPVEAACKSLVKTRLCRSGMRWSRNGGQHILTLRP